MHGIEARGLEFGKAQPFEAHNAQTGGFHSGQNFAAEVTGHGIGFDDGKGGLLHAHSLLVGWMKGAAYCCRAQNQTSRRRGTRATPPLSDQARQGGQGNAVGVADGHGPAPAARCVGCCVQGLQHGLRVAVRVQENVALGADQACLPCGGSQQRVGAGNAVQHQIAPARQQGAEAAAGVHVAR